MVTLHWFEKIKVCGWFRPLSFPLVSLLGNWCLSICVGRSRGGGGGSREFCNRNSFAMTKDHLMNGPGVPRPVQTNPESSPSMMSSFFSFHQHPEATRIFDELPMATIVQVSRPDAGDISPALLSYTIEVQYKQV